MKEKPKGSKTKKVLTIFKKSNEMESKKAKEKKLKKKHKPKGMGARRLGMFAFWFMFTFMFIIMLSGMFSSSAETDAIVEDVQSDKINSDEAVEFTKDFLHEYFTWKTDRHGSDLRKDKLQPYLTNNVDSMGGLIFDDEWSSSIKMSDITLKDKQQIDGNKSRFIFKVKFTLKGETDEKDTDVKLESLNLEDRKKFDRSIKVKKGIKTKETQKFISVPVYYDAEKKCFAVYELPSFTYVNEGNVDDAGENDIKKLKRVTDTFTENNLNAFTQTFFESFSKDSRDKLNYILEDERHLNGLNGSMGFAAIDKIDIYHVDENNNKFIIDTKIQLNEPSTNLEFINDYLLVVKRKDQRYIVESLNDEKFIKETIQEYIKIKEDEENEDVSDEEIINDDFNYQDKLDVEENDNNNDNNNSD